MDDWIDALKETADPWIEVTEGAVLRSVLFDELTSAELVRDRAVILIEQLHGAMAASQGAKPIQFDGVVIQFKALTNCSSFLAMFHPILRLAWLRWRGGLRFPVRPNYLRQMAASTELFLWKRGFRPP
jgi:hypothetical protein